MRSQLRGVAGIALLIAFFSPALASAAATPALGTAVPFAIVANTYTNPVPGTTVNGDIGFTTGPAVVPAGARSFFGSGAAFTSASTDANTALAALNAEPCTFTFAAGPVDLATDTTHGPIGVYAPGVYCVPTMAPSVSIGAAGITLSGQGTYIFRFNRSLVTATNSVVTLSNGAAACDVFWTPLDNAITSTLGENSVFVGTIFDNVRLELRNNVKWTGRALLPSGTLVTSVDDTITLPAACTPPTPPVVDPPVVVPPAEPPVVLPPVVEPPVVLPPAVEPPVIPPVEPPTTVTSIEEPKAPNTGTGGNSFAVILTLALSAIVAARGALYLRENR